MLNEESKEYVIVFELLPDWDEIEPLRLGHTFSSKVTLQLLKDTAKELFKLPDLFPCYELKASTPNGYIYNLTEQHFAFLPNFKALVVPRYCQVTFHVATWKIDYNRAEIQKRCKESQIAGSVTRDNVNTIEVTLQHQNGEILAHFLSQLEAEVKIDGGYICDIEHSFGWGTLNPKVIAHRGTARRNDNQKSWHDEDAKSGSTHFNIPRHSSHGKID